MSAPTDKATSFDEAIRHIRAESAVWVRMAAVLRDDGKWYARLVELTTGSAPPSWTLMEWNYSRALFAAVLETGASVAATNDAFSDNVILASTSPASATELFA